jgi:hypothetical protein
VCLPFGHLGAVGERSDLIIAYMSIYGNYHYYTHLGAVGERREEAIHPLLGPPRDRESLDRIGTERVGRRGSRPRPLLPSRGFRKFRDIGRAVHLVRDDLDRARDELPERLGSVYIS